MCGPGAKLGCHWKESLCDFFVTHESGAKNAAQCVGGSTGTGVVHEQITSRACWTCNQGAARKFGHIVGS